MITRFGYEQLKGQPFKLPCRVVSTTNISDFNNPPLLVDGLQLSIGDRVLVNNQTNGSENGVYVVKTTSLWQRSIDMSLNDDFIDGLQVYINEGSYAGKTFNLDIPTNFQLGSSSISFNELIFNNQNSASKQLISGGAVWSGVGLTFSVSYLQYTFTGPLLTAGPTAVSLSNGDATYSRFDAIVVDELGSVTVIQGDATPDPITPAVPDDQLLIQYISVADNATTPESGVTSAEYIYRDNDYWIGSTYSTSYGTSIVNFLYTGVTPFQGTYSTRMRINRFTSVIWTRASGILLKNYSYLIFRVYFPDSVSNSKNMRILFRRGSTTVGSYAYPFTNGGISRTTTGVWQLCVLPLNYFGSALNEFTQTGTPNTVDKIVIDFSGGFINTYAQAYIDDIYLTGGYSTPTSNSNISVQSNGVLVGNRNILNFISGSNSTVTVTDSALNGRVDIRISASASSSSGNVVTNPGDYRLLTSTGSSTTTAIAQPSLTFNPNTAVLGLTGSFVISGTPSGGDVFSVYGSSGQLFSVSDSLDGSLFSVNDITGFPILEVFSDNTTIIGDYQAQSLYTTKKVTLGTGTTNIYSFATASYTGAFVDYILINGVNARSGNVMGIWNGSDIKFVDNSTTDIGTTIGVTFSFVISGTYAVLQADSGSSGWLVKTIIRSI